MRFRKLQFAWGVAYTLLILGVIAEYGLGPAWPVWMFLTMLTLVGLEFVSFGKIEAGDLAFALC